MLRYFTSDVTYSTYVNCNIKIITHRDKFCRLAVYCVLSYLLVNTVQYKKKAHFKHFIIKSKKLM